MRAPWYTSDRSQADAKKKSSAKVIEVSKQALQFDIKEVPGVESKLDRQPSKNDQTRMQTRIRLYIHYIDSIAVNMGNTRIIP